VRAALNKKFAEICDVAEELHLYLSAGGLKDILQPETKLSRTFIS
jgi:hypothetical protein